MAWMAPKLKHRVQIGKGTMTPDMDTGGFSFSFESLITCWAGVDKVSDYIRAIRGVNTSGAPSHKFTIRRESVRYLGRSFSTAFDTGFDNIEDLAPVKADWFLLLESGSTIKGRRFRLVGIERDEVNKEYMRLAGEEMEEIGTGWPE